MNERSTHAAPVGLLWLALVLGMILHFNYDVSGLRYGVPFEAADAKGSVPWSNFVVKCVFYVVPFLLAVATTGAPGRAYRIVNLVLAGLFTLANISHLITTARRADDTIDYAQIVLLTAVLIASVQLIRVSRSWLRDSAKA